MYTLIQHSHSFISSQYLVHGLVFCRHTNETSLLSAIEKVKCPGGELENLGVVSTNMLITQIFNPLFGERPLDVLNVLMGITDGTPDLNGAVADLFATLYQEARTAMFVVCVAPGCTETWAHDIASPPKKVSYAIFAIFRSGL